MGIMNIKISQEGSFKPLYQQSFSAMRGGHAQAITEAIEWLAGDVMSSAIKLDHELQSQGAKPEIGFGMRKE